jgi:DNA end-binding protein Ku
MASRTTWKGFLTLGRVSCSVRLHPAVLRNERLGFQPVNRSTLNRVEMRPYDPMTGRDISREAVVHGYEVEPGRFVPLEEREIAELQLDSSRNVVLDRFIARSAVDFAYLEQPYFVVPGAKVVEAAFAVIREAMRRAGRLGMGRIVLEGRERPALVEPRGRGMLLTTLRAAAEVRGDDSVFAELGDEPPDEAVVELATRLVTERVGDFDPRRDFRDRYQEALFQLVQAKLRGERPSLPKPLPPPLVIDLRAALEASLAREDFAKPPAPSLRRVAQPRPPRVRKEQ